MSKTNIEVEQSKAIVPACDGDLHENIRQPAVKNLPKAKD
jgi:hypothetical protein